MILFPRKSSFSQFPPSPLRTNRKLIPVAEYFKSLALPLDLLHVLSQDPRSLPVQDHLISEADSLPAMVLLSLTSSIWSGKASLELKVCESSEDSLLNMLILTHSIE